MQLILKIGGSILYNNDDINVNLIKNWVNTIEKLRESGHKIGIVIGGGSPARKFVRAANELGADGSSQDLLGIESARQNARLFISALDNAYPEPPKNFHELMLALSTHDLIICGGFQPGQSTNAVASIFAEYTRADWLFNLTKVDQVYDKDPQNNIDAKGYDNLSYDELEVIILDNKQHPGGYALFDHLGLGVVKRSGVKLAFINGNNPEYINDILNGKQRGTIVG